MHHSPFAVVFSALLVSLASVLLPDRAVGGVVINEIHYNPDIKTERVEFIELHNEGATATNLAGWQFTAGVQYTFPSNTVIAANGYLVVAEKPSALVTKFSFAGALGPYSGGLSKYGETITLQDAAGTTRDEVNYQLGFPWPTVGDMPGKSIELIHPSLDNDLGGSWRSAGAAGPSPGRVNTVRATNAPPQIRQVEHQPEAPTAGQIVKVTAKVTDPNGVASVLLQYQLVNPGSYIELTDPAYATTWTNVTMRDDGTNGDLTALDGLYTAELAGALQTHRRLVRYRITVTDALGASVRVPYADDPQPNFAYFCYNGIPGWSAATRPGATPVVNFSSNTLSRLPAIHLLARSNAVATATWFERYPGDLYKWSGALVYDGKVYDHIHYRARGGVWRYSMVKNMWKFDINRGHDFVMRDNWGRKFNTGWTKLNLGACIQQGNFNHRGEQGMFESVGFRLFQLAGMEAPNTTFTTFRVVDDAVETPADQYDGDFWGLYLAIEQEDGRFLEEHGLADGNFYKMENGTGELNNTGPNGPTDKSDLNALLSTYSNSGLPDLWWRTNLNLPTYFAYQAVVQAIHHYDIADGKNYFYYINPTNRMWQVMSWDLDLTWADNMYREGQQGGNEPFKSRVLSDFAIPGARTNITRQFRNQIREFRDLMWNTDQAFKLIDEHATLLRGDTNAPTLLEADRSKWDYNPKMNDLAYTPHPSDKAGQGRFYQWPNEPTVSKNFNGCVQLMRNYVLYRATNTAFSLDTMSLEPQRPNKPVIAYAGPAGYPINRLSFRSSSFSTPDGGASFAALKWRLAEVSYPGTAGFDPAEAWKYEITSVWESSNNVFVADITLPPSAVRAGRTFRVRAQLVDNQGRNSNWSDPIEFGVNEPDGAADLQNHLRITEVMFNPPAGGFEFLELHNTSASVTLDLAGVKFTQGIDYTFPSGASLGPGGYLLVVGAADFAAFRAWSGVSPTVMIYGPWTGSLNNGGEQLTLRTAAGGTDIVSFNFGDGRDWPPAADGAGHSLVLDPAALQAEGDGAGNFGGNWHASGWMRGSPGRADETATPPVLLNEVVAHTDFTNALDSNDWIELFNPGETNFVFGAGWYLSDEAAALKKWAIPATNVVPSRGWLTFDEVSGFHNPTNIGFGLSKSGEQVFLSFLPGTTEDRVVDAVSFKGQDNDWSVGRFPDGASFWFALRPRTRDGANALPPSTAVVTEIHFHPPEFNGTNDNTLDEFIELHNPTAYAVPFFDTNGTWRLNGGMDFLFPTNVTLNPGEYVTIVNFNPSTNAPQLAAFRAIFGITNPAALILGPYGGKLDNSSDRVALERPQMPDLPGDATSWIIVDEVTYADQSPWPCAADGSGNSLNRVAASGHGSDPANWTAQSPTAGRGRDPLPPGVPSIVGQPQSRAAPTNGSASFSVAACGTPPFRYQWFFNGTNIAGATNGTLTLSGLTLADSGEYSVEVGNAAGPILSTPATLWVQLPPLISSQPQGTNVVRDQPAWFGVQAEGTAPFSYQWRLNGTNVSGQTNLFLLLPAVRADQAGNYNVLVQNTAGALLSSNALLIVRIPATITNPPKSTNLAAGTTNIFTVGAIGTGALRYQWFFNGAPITGATQTSLVLTNLQLPDGGDYTVRVTDDIGTAVSQPARLIVLVRPFFVRHPESVTILEGQNATFTIEAGGTPPLGYYWRSNTITFVPPDKAGPVLTLTNPPVSSSVLYFACVITNIAVPNGVLSQKGYLNVLADHDRDGMADAWEAQHGFNTNSPADVALDADGDTLTNLQEYQAGTDPLDPASYLKVEQILTDTVGGLAMQLRFVAVSNRTYSVLAADAVPGAEWGRFADIASAGTNRVIGLSDPRPSSSSQRYYRLVTPRVP